MFYYDDDGEIQMTDDDELRRRHHAVTMLRTSAYGLRPSAAGQLNEILGEVDPNESAEEARRRVRHALEEIGFSQTNFSVAVGALDTAWQAKINVGDQDVT